MLSISSQLSGIIAGDEKIPVGMVWVYDTTNTVPSNGMFVRYFSGIDPTLTGNLRRTQFEPIIMKDWGGGLPVELSNYVGTRITNSGQIVSDPFSITYSGYFYAAESGVYQFSTRSNGGTDLYVNGVNALSGTRYLSNTLTVTSSQIIGGGGKGTGPGTGNGGTTQQGHTWNLQTPITQITTGIILVTGTYPGVMLNTGWYPFYLNFYWNQSLASGTTNNPFLAAYYKSPNMKRPNVISASVINYQSGFLQPSILGNLIFANETVDQGLSTQFDFEVAMNVSGDYTWDKAKADFGKLKINRLTKIFQGYVTQSGYAQTNGYSINLNLPIDGLVEKFTGFIDNVTVNQTSQQLTATAKCRDFRKKLINALNENYPNRANYSPAIVSGIDKNGFFNIETIMPNAYDRWPVFDVIETIALNGGIDPSKINRGKWDSQNHFIMESNLNWPTTDTVDVNSVITRDGDPYLYKFKYGETLDSEIKNVSNLIGYNAYFDESGDLVVREPARTNRIEVYETGNYASQSIFYSGNWTMSININTSNRVFMSPISNGQFTTGILSISFSGVGIGLFETIHPSGSQYNVKIYDSSSALVFNSGFNNSGILSYGYNQELTRNLPYGGYTAFIYPSGDFRVEGFEYYTQNIYKPAYTFMDNRDITSISIDHNDYTVRNEVIAVGQQTSDRGYLYSKAIDLDSISNPLAFNYVGEKRTVTIIEPTIQSQNRLDWLARSILGKYRRKQKNISVTTQGLPHIQINDPVGIKTTKLNFNSDVVTYDINNEEIYYVTNISSNTSRGKYSSTFTLTSLKPIESWRPPVSITNDVLALIYSGNDNTIFANYRQETLNTNVTSGYGYNGYSRQAAFISFDLLVDVDRLWVWVSDTRDGDGAFKFIDVKSKNPTWVYQYPQDSSIPNPPPMSAVPLHNGGGEKWGRIVVPTAQNTFNGGQWIGQNSLSHVRADGKYPVAIWAQFTTADSSSVFQGLWIPRSGTIDNRDRTLSWSTTSDGNAFIAYNAVGGQQMSMSNLDPTLKQAYLPAFSTSSDPIKVDMWIGPPASGYQIVNANILTSGKSTYGGDEWNQATMFYNIQDTNLPTNNKFLNYLSRYTYTEAYGGGMQSGFGTPGATSKVYTVPSNGNPSGPIKVKTGRAPWKTGDNIMFDGPVPTVNAIMNHLDYTFSMLYNNDAAAIYKIPDKSMWGFAPQGFDVRSRASAQADYLGQFNQFDMALWPQIPDVIETIGHSAEYLTLRVNHDCTLNYITYHMVANNDGHFRTVGTFNHVINQPFNGDLSIYLSPSYGNNHMYGQIYKNDFGYGVAGDLTSYYDTYKSQTKVMNIYPSWEEYLKFSSYSPGFLTHLPVSPYGTSYTVDPYDYNQSVNGWSWAIEGQYFIMHFFQITETDSGKQSYFSMKTTMGQLIDYVNWDIANAYSAIDNKTAGAGAGFLQKYYRPPTFLCRPGEGAVGDYTKWTIVSPRIL